MRSSAAKSFGAPPQFLAVAGCCCCFKMFGRHLGRKLVADQVEEEQQEWHSACPSSWSI